MTLAITIEKRRESEIARALEIRGRVRDHPECLNEADTKVAIIDPIPSASAGSCEIVSPVSQQYRSPSSEHPRVFASGVFVDPVRSS
jgi:hypothetical protein